MVLAPDRIDVEIEYCAPCEYLPNAVELAGQVLGDFQGWIKEMRLTPGSGGVFKVAIGGKWIFDNEKGGPTFPDYSFIQDSFRSRLTEVTGQVASS